jgi:hypothetical protein
MLPHKLATNTMIKTTQGPNSKSGNDLPMSPSTTNRISALVIAVLLGHFFIVVQAQILWKNHWILKDGQQGIAVVTKVPWTGHKAVAYRYRVNQRDYTGEDARSWQDPRYAHVMVGEESVVYFSSSHPWLSLLNRPRTAMVEGLPVVVLAWLFIILFINTAMNPKSRWALNIGVSKAKTQTNE